METVVLDDCLYYLREAEQYLDMLVDVSPYEEIFETYNPEVQLKVQQNEKAKTGVMGAMRKALEALKRMLNNLVDTIKNFFDTRKLDTKQREAYEAFKEACAKNPELKNKKITVKDYRQFQKDYNEILAQAKETDKQLAENRVVNTDAVFNRITEFCNNIKNGVVVSVSADAALNLASSSREIAQMISKSLKEDKELHDKFEAAMGKHETKRFERQMKSLGKRHSLQRAIMKMKKTYCSSVAEAMDKTFENVWDLAQSGAKLAKGMAGELDPELNIKGNVLQRGKQTTTALFKNRKNVSDVAKNATKSDIARHLMGNDEIRNTVMTAIKTNSKATKDARATYKQQKKALKRYNREQKRKKPWDQSAMQSLMGINDPNSKVGEYFRNH